MPVDFKVSRGDGETRVFNANEIAQGLGPDVLGVSPDGMSISMKGPNGGAQAVPIQQILEQRGLKMESAVPSGANYDSIHPGWRAAMSSLPSDEARRTFLTEQFQKEGIKNPQVSGTGRDWYIFDPETKQYHGLTNNPDWDTSDLVEAGMEAPRFVGAALGAGAGAAAGLGPGSIPGAMAGAAAGGAAGDALARGVHSMIDPDVGKQIAEHPWQTAGDIGMKSALDAAGVGVGGMAAKTFGKLAAPLSNAARAGGFFAENTGRLVNKAATALDTGGFRSIAEEVAGKTAEEAAQIRAARAAQGTMNKEILGSFIPGAREAIFSGNLARLPNQAVRGFAKLPGYVGERLESNIAGIPQYLGEKLATKQVPVGPASPGLSEMLGLSEESPLRAGIQSAADKIKGFTPRIQSAADKLKTITNDIYQKSNLGTNLTNAFRQASEEAGAWLGGQPKPAARVTGEDILGNLGKKISPRAADWGAKVGRGLENLEGFGESLEKVGQGVAGAGLKATRAASFTMGKGGALARNASYLTEPLEPRSYVRYWSEEQGRPKYNLADPRQAGKNRARLYPSTLAEE